MFTIIGSDGAEYGPVDAQTIKSWIAGGRAALYMRARRAGETEWKTLADYPEFSEAANPPPLPDAAPAQPVTVDSRAFAEDLIARAKPLDVFGCISRGWEFCKSDYWPILGVTLVALLVQSAIGLVPFGNIITAGIFTAGIYYYYLGRMRGQRREMQDVFVGFSRMTGPLILGSLVMCGIILGTLFPGYVIMIFGSAANVPAVALAGVGFLCLAMLVMVYLSIVWMYTFPLIIDRGLGFWDAMNVSRRVIGAQFWRMFGLVILCGLISFAGMLLCIVGVVFVLPLMFGAYACAYEDLCNPR